MATDLSVGHLTLYIGPMCSRKTTELQSHLVTLSKLGMNCLYINHTSDTRVEQGLTYGDESLSTHNPAYKGLPSNIKSIKADTLGRADIADYSAIGIDECQWFSDLFDIVEYWVNTLNKKVICAGLSGNYKMRRYGQILDLIPLADKVEKRSATCMLCLQQYKEMRDADFTKRLSSNEDDKETDVNAKYLPVCRRHYFDDATA